MAFSGTLADFAISTLFGAMVFFPVVVAPTVFKVLDAEHASRFLRALFPGYYAFLIVTSGIGALALAFTSPLRACVLGAIALSTLAIRQVLMPRINRDRDGEIQGDARAARRFSQGHTIAVLVNALQILAVIYVVADPLVFSQ